MSATMSTVTIRWTTKVTEYHEVELDESKLIAHADNWRDILNGDDDNQDPADWLGNFEGDDKYGVDSVKSVEVDDRRDIEFEEVSA
jgi:hypothetical protein